MNFDSWLTVSTNWIGENSWIVQVFSVVFLVSLLNFIQFLVIRRLINRSNATENPWDDAVVNSAHGPLTLCIWVAGLAFAADIAGNETNSVIFDAVAPLRKIGIIIAFTWFLLRFIRNVQKNIIARSAAESSSFDPTTVDAIGKLLRASVLITAFLVALQSLGFSISGVLAFGGVGGIAIGFAAKDLLANFFGGMMIFLDRPFSVGDWIRSPDREIEGTVENIGWRLTCIRTFDKRPIYVPNSAFSSIAVINPSRMTHRRIYETVGIRYQDISIMETIVNDVTQMLKQHPDIDTSQTLMVNFNAFSASSVDFFVYTFTHTTVWTDYHKVKQDILLKIAKIIEDHGAEIAYPTSTVHIPEALQMTSPSSLDHGVEESR